MAFLPALIVGGSLLIAVADGIPAINYDQTCQQAASGKLGLSERVEDCTDDEKHARDQLTGQWNQYDAGSRARCTRMAAAGRPSSYVELLTCLEMDQLAKKIRPDTATAMDLPGADPDREEDAPPRPARRPLHRIRAASGPPAAAPPPNGLLQSFCRSPLGAILPACR